MIVQQECLPLWLKEHRADPCLSVTVGAADGPHTTQATRSSTTARAGRTSCSSRRARITGIESPELEEPGAPNYFDAAWKSREALALYLGRPVSRTAVGLALNSRRARSQDQLHIHI